MEDKDYQGVTLEHAHLFVLLMNAFMFYNGKVKLCNRDSRLPEPEFYRKHFAEFCTRTLITAF